MDQNTPTQSSTQPMTSTSQPAPEKKKRGCFWWIGLIVIILIVLAIIGALRNKDNTSNSTSNNSSTSSSSTATNATPQGTSELPGVYKNTVGGYQIRYPQGWVLDSAAVAIVGVAFKETDTADAPAVDVYAIPNNDNLTLEQAKTTYTNSSALLGTSNILSFRVRSETTKTFKDFTAYEVVTTFKSKNTNEDAKGKMIIFQHAGRNYALYAHGPEATFAQKEATFDSIINSFSLL